MDALRSPAINLTALAEKDSGFSESFMSDGIDLIYDYRACAGMQSKFSCFPQQFSPFYRIDLRLPRMRRNAPYTGCVYTNLQAPPPLSSVFSAPFYQFLLEVWLKVGLLEID